MRASRNAHKSINQDTGLFDEERFPPSLQRYLNSTGNNRNNLEYNHDTDPAEHIKEISLGEYYAKAKEKPVDGIQRRRIKKY